MEKIKNNCKSLLLNELIIVIFILLSICCVPFKSICQTDSKVFIEIEAIPFERNELTFDILDFEEWIKSDSANTYEIIRDIKTCHKIKKILEEKSYNCDSSIHTLDIRIAIIIHENDFVGAYYFCWSNHILQKEYAQRNNFSRGRCDINQSDVTKISLCIRNENIKKSFKGLINFMDK